MKFTVEKMTCGHCVKAVQQALQEADSNAQIDINLAEKTLDITGQLSKDQVIAILQEEGYPATQLEA